MPVSDHTAEIGKETLSHGEIEALRLKDLKELDQKEAAEKMGISQPTFHRLVREARKKVARALVNGNSINVEGGEFEMKEPIIKKDTLKPRFRTGEKCVCPACGFKIAKQAGIPCRHMRCPECKEHMIRK